MSLLQFVLQIRHQLAHVNLMLLPETVILCALLNQQSRDKFLVRAYVSILVADSAIFLAISDFLGKLSLRIVSIQPLIVIVRLLGLIVQHLCLTSLGLWLAILDIEFLLVTLKVAGSVCDALFK